MKKVLTITMVLILIASSLFEILSHLFTGITPPWVMLLKIVLLVIGLVCLRFTKTYSNLSKLCSILLVILLSQGITDYISHTSFWTAAFSSNAFLIRVGSNILLKAVGIMPVLISLLVMFPSADDFYLGRGDLKVKANRIPWLGIDHGKISWGKLSIISAVLISLGTVLLTMITATGFSLPQAADRLLAYLPVILLFALLNSFCEGLVYRNAILGTLKNVLPPQYAVLAAALFFGVAHYFGVPGGPLGAVMSGLLGWYMCRSMVETNGFVSAWIIHFMQDAVIFSTLCVLG